MILEDAKIVKGLLGAKINLAYLGKGAAMTYLARNQRVNYPGPSEIGFKITGAIVSCFKPNMTSVKGAKGEGQENSNFS